MLQCLLIMAKIHLATFRQIVHDRQDYYINGGNVDWKARARWQRFQAYLDYFRNDLGAFSRYAKREFSNPIFQEQLDMTRELKESLLAEAQAVGSLIRDQLQVGVGMASLEESQRSLKEGNSVELSKIAACSSIQYQALTDRVYTVTILAFVFIPTSVTFSIFGMNVQEINDTGKDIWVFIVTAILMTGTAFTVWGLSFLVRADWQRRHHKFFSREERLGYAKWLIKHPKDWGNMPWGTLIGLVTNGRYGNRGINGVEKSHLVFLKR